MSLFRQHAKSEAISVIVWAVSIGLVTFFATCMWNVLRASGELAELQKAIDQAQGVIRGMLGPGASLLSIDGWIQGYVLGSWTSVLWVIFTAMFVVGMITREMDRRTIEFVLSRPISRARLLLARWGVLALSLVFMHLVQFVGLWSALATLGQVGHLGRYAVAEVNSLLLYLFLGGLMLLVSLYFDDYGPGTGAILGIGLALNLAHMALADATGGLKKLRELLPFSLYDVQAIISKGTVPWAHLVILGSGALLFLLLSVWLFERKQIAV
ncbi:MAG: ABC transporter permease subunit [Mycobacterium leprae]